MFRQIFLLLLFLFVCSELCGQVFAAQIQQNGADGNTIADFLTKTEHKKEKLLNSQGTGKEGEDFIVENIESVFIAAPDGVMVALAEAENNGQNDKISLLAKFYETTEKNTWGQKAVKEAGKWKIQLAAKDLDNNKKDTVIKSVAIVAKEKKIYHITVSNDKLDTPSESSSSPTEWHFRVVEGTVGDKNIGGGSSTTEKTIKWAKATFSPIKEDGKLKEKLNIQQKPLPLCESFAFVIGKEKNIYFVMKCTEATDSTDKNITAVFLLDDTTQKTLKLLHVENIENCYPSFFQLNGEIIMAPTLCPDKKSHKVKMFRRTEKNFDDSNEPIFRLRDFFMNKKYFTAANINETKDVLLFTQQEKNSGSKSTVHLWMSDGSRVSNVGTIVDGINTDEIFYGSLLHTNAELFLLHQTYKTGSGLLEKNKFSLTRLKVQLNKIKITLIAWNENGEKIENFYKINDTTKNFWYTKGLVGFLSDTVSNNNQIWHDKYDYVNATVTSGEKAPDGITLKGKNGKAIWPVGEKDQPYNFIDNGLTLVATVKIDKHGNEKDNSLLGVVLNKEGNKRVGLLCSKDKTLIVKFDERDADLKIEQKECNEGKLYVVAFVLETNGKIEIYVDGEQLAVLDNEEITVSKTIKEFYFGVEGNTQHAISDVTIRNVLLYNRPLDNEIKQFKPEQNAEADTQAVSGNDNGKTTKPGKKVTETDTPSDTSATTEDRAVRVRKSLFMFVLFVLLSPCVHALF